MMETKSQMCFDVSDWYFIIFSNHMKTNSKLDHVHQTSNGWFSHNGFQSTNDCVFLSGVHLVDTNI